MKSGILVIDKAKDWTSFDVVAYLRGVLKMKKLGHTGTLDPMATGVLPVCIGRATKAAALLSSDEKTYRAVFRLGTETDTEDITGRVLSEKPYETDPEKVKEAVLSFLGTYPQVPPMYAAIKQDGKRLYELAREGKTVERAPREVTVYEITDLSVTPPEVSMTVTVSKGTYVRSLVRDIGKRLGCGAVLTSLRRLSAGDFSIEQAITVKEAAALMERGQLEEKVLSLDTLFSECPAFRVKAEAKKKALNGSRLLLSETEGMETALPSDLCRGYLPDGGFLGLYEKKGDSLTLKNMFYEP